MTDVQTAPPMLRGDFYVIAGLISVFPHGERCVALMRSESLILKKGYLFESGASSELSI